MPVTPWALIDEASDQISAGQPVTALPRQNDTFQSQQAWIARMDEFDRQAKAARQAANQAGRDAAMLDQMGRVAKSTKDIEVAMQSQDFQRFTNDVAGGMAPFLALQRSPRAASSPLVAAMKAAAPPVAPTKLELPGMPPAVMANGRPYWPPASAMPSEPLSTTAVPITDPSGNVLGHRAQIGPRAGTIVQRAPAAGAVTQEKRMVIDTLGRELRAVEKSISDNALYASSPSIKAKIVEWEKKRDDLRQKLSGLLPEAYPSTNNVAMPPGFGQSTNVPRGTTKPVGVSGQGTREDPARPETQEQFDSVKSGMYFRNPKDGKPYRKK